MPEQLAARHVDARPCVQESKAGITAGCTAPRACRTATAVAYFDTVHARITQPADIKNNHAQHRASTQLNRTLTCAPVAA